MKKLKQLLSIALALIISISTMIIEASMLNASAAEQFVVSSYINAISYNSNATVTLQWTSGQGFMGFQIAKKKTGDKKYTYINTESPIYNDKNIVCGTIYYYQVRTIHKDYSNGSTYYGSWSNVKSITTLYRPTVTNLNNMKTFLNINWNKIKGVSNYKLAFKRITDKAWNYRTVKTNYFNVPNPTKGATYAIQVCPMNGSVAGQWSQAKTIAINN